MNKRQFLQTAGLGILGYLAPNSEWKNSSKTKKSFTIAHITDIHMMPLIGAAKGLEKCFHHIQTFENQVDLILNTGDSIMEAHNTSKFLVKKQWNLLRSVIQSENHIPIKHCIGNHDINYHDNHWLSFDDGKKWAQDELQLDKTYYSFETDFWKIIVLDSVQPAQNTDKWYAAYIDDAQFDWLNKELTTTKKYVMIASHIPILAACVFFDGNHQTNSAWSIPNNWMHTDTKKLHELFYQFPNIKLAVSGHIHLADKVEYNGITYCCNGAVSGKWWKGANQHTQAGYAMLELFDDGTFQNTYMHYNR
jgi:3',5'-cyclic-AMP phosphodiesterase